MRQGEAVDRIPNRYWANQSIFSNYHRMFNDRNESYLCDCARTGAIDKLTGRGFSSRFKPTDSRFDSGKIFLRKV